MSFSGELERLDVNIGCAWACLGKIYSNKNRYTDTVFRLLIELEGKLSDVDDCIKCLYDETGEPKLNQETKLQDLRLNNCPFCGSLNVTAIPNSSGWSVECDSCQTEGPLEESREAAEQEWNRRS